MLSVADCRGDDMWRVSVARRVARWCGLTFLTLQSEQSLQNTEVNFDRQDILQSAEIQLDTEIEAQMRRDH